MPGTAAKTKNNRVGSKKNHDCKRFMSDTSICSGLSDGMIAVADYFDLYGYRRQSTAPGHIGGKEEVGLHDFEGFLTAILNGVLFMGRRSALSAAAAARQSSRHLLLAKTTEVST